LYYRLNVIPVRLMPLRERKADIPLLSQYFMNRVSMKLNKKSVNISEETMQSFLEYEWPGNVRELENIIELIVNTESVPDRFIKRDCNINALEQTEVIHENWNADVGLMEDNLKLEVVEIQHIMKVLDYYKGNISLAAKALGIGRNTLYRKMENIKMICSEIEHCSIM
jgi:transcriptional regulator with PAS, ATPase and Fis domain